MHTAKKKSLLRRAFNRVLHTLARNLPGAMTVRPFLHRLRGVKIGKWVWIGDDVYLENEHPELVEIQEGAVLSIRAMVIAHTRGQGKVIIERRAFVGPCAVVICASGRTLRIGEGAVISTGCHRHKQRASPDGDCPAPIHADGKGQHSLRTGDLHG